MDLTRPKQNPIPSSLAGAREDDENNNHEELSTRIENQGVENSGQQNQSAEVIPVADSDDLAITIDELELARKLLSSFEELIRELTNQKNAYIYLLSYHGLHPAKMFRITRRSKSTT